MIKGLSTCFLLFGVPRHSSSVVKRKKKNVAMCPVLVNEAIFTFGLFNVLLFVVKERETTVVFHYQS